MRRLFLAAALLATPGAALAAGPRVYVKQAPVAAAQMDADLDSCVQQVLAYMNGPHSPDPRPSGYQTPMESVARAFDMKGPRMAAALEVRCMADKGYVVLPLAAAEDKALSKAKGRPARDAWYDAFVATDLSARIAAVPAP